METFALVCLGIGLSAACGFRVFVPLLVLSIAAHTGHVQLAKTFAWIGSTPALIAFSVATAAEIGAYYIPWLDNALDTIAAPLAAVAGVVATASVVTNIDPFWSWTLAIIAGGGAAASTQIATTKARAASSLTTGGLANPVVATVENVSSTALSVVSFLWPIAALIFTVAILVACWVVIWFVGKRVLKFFRKSAPPVVTTSS
jgi:hypothetical protein